MRWRGIGNWDERPMNRGCKAEGSQNAQSSKDKTSLIGRLQPLLVKHSQLHNMKSSYRYGQCRSNNRSESINA